MEQIKTNMKKGIDLFDKEAIRRNIEIWRIIDGYYNYEVSSKGNIRNVATGRILKQRINRDGYYIVDLRNETKAKTLQVHRIIANAFIENVNGKKCVDHINNNKTDNNAINLRFATNQENNFNSSICSNNTSGYKGVSWHKQKSKWRARIKINNKSIHIGYFVSLEEAKTARQNKAKELFGEYINSCEL